MVCFLDVRELTVMIRVYLHNYRRQRRYCKFVMIYSIWMFSPCISPRKLDWYGRSLADDRRLRKHNCHVEFLAELLQWLGRAALKSRAYWQVFMAMLISRNAEKRKCKKKQTNKQTNRRSILHATTLYNSHNHSSYILTYIPSGPKKWGHFTFLLVTNECMYQILWSLAHLNYIKQRMAQCQFCVNACVTH